MRLSIKKTSCVLALAFLCAEVYAAGSSRDTESITCGAAHSTLTPSIPSAMLSSFLYFFSTTQKKNLAAQSWVDTPITNLSSFKNEQALFVQKVSVPDNAHIIVIGDLHGRLDCLFAIMDDLSKQNIIDQTNATLLRPNTYIIFLGDYTDRGPLGTEVLSFAIALATTNPNHVFPLRGNHEERTINEHYGFFAELTSKYGKSAYALFNQFTNDCYYYFPSAILLEVQNNEKTYDYELFCHGGIDFGINLKPLLTSTHTCMTIEKRSADWIAEPFKKRESKYVGPLCGLQWCDFANQQPYYNARERGLIANRRLTKRWLRLQNEPEHTIRGIVRGHQHEVNSDIFGNGLVRTVISCWPEVSQDPDKKNIVQYLTIDCAPSYEHWEFTFHAINTACAH